MTRHIHNQCKFAGKEGGGGGVAPMGNKFN